MNGLYVMELELVNKDKALIETMQGKMEVIGRGYGGPEDLLRVVRTGHKKLGIAFGCTEEESVECMNTYVVGALIHLLMHYKEKLKFSFAFIRGEEIGREFVKHMDFNYNAHAMAFRTTVQNWGGKSIELTGFQKEHIWDAVMSMTPKLNQVLSILSLTNKANDEIDLFTLIKEINKKEAKSEVDDAKDTNAI